MAVMSIDAVTFRDKSRVGDQIDIVATVSCVFNRSMEVAVSVDALDVTTNSRRRINTGFITFIATSAEARRSNSNSDDDGDILTKFILPKTVVSPLPDYKEGSSRRSVRETLLRVFSVRAEPIPWNSSSEKLLQEISICTVWGLLRTAFSSKLLWSKVISLKRGEVPEPGLPPSATDIEISVNKDTWGMGMISIKASALVPNVHAKKVFDLIVDLEQRVCWDVVLRKASVVKKLDDNNSITREEFDSLAVEGEPHDYSLFTACRKMVGNTHDEDNDNRTSSASATTSSTTESDEEGCSFVVASRSVICDELVPPVAGVRRGEVLPSGFIVESVHTPSSQSDLTTRCTYVASLNPRKLGSEVDLHTLALLLHQNISRLAEMATPSPNDSQEVTQVQQPKEPPTMVKHKKKDSKTVLATLQRIAKALRS